MTVFLGAYLHTIDPYAIELWPGGPIRWYGLSYLLGFALGYMLIRHIARIGRSTVDPNRVGDLIMTLAIGVVVGGRVGYVLFYRQELLWQFSDSSPWWGLLAINEGGMASHGGMVGAILASWWYARRALKAGGGKGHNILHVLDLVSFAAPLGLFFGRIANFVNAELIGRPCVPDLPWAVKFPHEIYDWPMERLAPLVSLVRGDTTTSLTAPPTLFDLLPWIVEQLQSHNEAVIQIVEPMLTPRHPSQIYQAILEGLVVFAILATAWLKPRKPGTIAAMFCIGYGVARIIGEQFRLPDNHIKHLEFAATGITRGQWLSILLIVVGILLWRVAARQPNKPLGGWSSTGT